MNTLPLSPYQELVLQLEDAQETIDRLRKLIPGCDCDTPGQCWEPCGTLGHSARHSVAVPAGLKFSIAPTCTSEAQGNQNETH